ARFSEQIDPATINVASFKVSALAGTVNYDPATLTATFTPNVPLAAGTSYTLSVSTAVMDLAGNPLPLPANFPFTTAAFDTIPPAVNAVTPFDGLKNVPLTTTISAAFSETLDPLSLNAGSFTVTGQSYLSQAPFTVSGTVTLLTGGISLPSALFTPDAPLVPGTQYTATLSTAVKDRAGNPLAAPQVWSFATAPDGILIPGEGAPSIADALRALRLAVGLDQPTRDDRNHGDVAPLGPDGKPRPDGIFEPADALVILRKAIGLLNF